MKRSYSDNAKEYKEVFFVGSKNVRPDEFVKDNERRKLRDDVSRKINNKSYSSNVKEYRVVFNAKPNYVEQDKFIKKINVEEFRETVRDDYVKKPFALNKRLQVYSSKVEECREVIIVKPSEVFENARPTSVNGNSKFSTNIGNGRCIHCSCQRQGIYGPKVLCCDEVDNNITVIIVKPGEDGKNTFLGKLENNLDRSLIGNYERNPVDKPINRYIRDDVYTKLAHDHSRKIEKNFKENHETYRTKNSDDRLKIYEEFHDCVGGRTRETQIKESNDGSRNGRETRDRGSSSDDKRSRDSPIDGKGQGGRDDYRNRRSDRRSHDRSRSRDRRDSRDDKGRKDDRYSSKTDKYSRDDKDRRTDTYRDRKYRRSSSRDRRRSNSRERRRSSSRSRRRSSSRERRYSRSPRRDRSRRTRSRSRSRGRYGVSRPRYGYPKSNCPRNDSTETSADNQNNDSKDRFFMPGITGKYREQIEKRKLLWQKKDPQKQGEPNVKAQPTAAGTSTSRVTKIWEATTFAQDQDGKVASKFKRLMGIKGQTQDAVPVPPTDLIKKQEEMFSSMEQQYEVARTATHTMRGVGLGFSSSYPR